MKGLRFLFYAVAAIGLAAFVAETARVAFASDRGVNFKTVATSCTTSATQVASNPAAQVALYTTSSGIWIGHSNAVKANGNYPKITDSRQLTLNLSNSDKVWCITDSGTKVLVSIVEE